MPRVLALSFLNMHKLVSRPLVLRLNISIYQGPVDKVSNSASCLHTTGRTCSLCYKGDSEIQGIKLPGGRTHSLNFSPKLNLLNTWSTHHHSTRSKAFCWSKNIMIPSSSSRSVYSITWLSSACLQMTLSYLIKMMNLSKKKRVSSTNPTTYSCSTSDTCRFR
jgi:hypothetical protein